MSSLKVIPKVEGMKRAGPREDGPVLIDFTGVAELLSLPSPAAARKTVYRVASGAVVRLGRRCVRIHKKKLLEALGIAS